LVTFDHIIYLGGYLIGISVVVVVVSDGSPEIEVT